MTRLHFAARFGDLAGVRAELDRGIPVNADAGGAYDDAGTPLMWAAASRRAGDDMVRLLLDRGAYMNAVGGSLHRTPLREAAKSGSLAKVRTLLEAGADPTYCDANGYTILVSAATADGPEVLAVVRTLVAAGAPLDVASRYGESPLSVASRVGRFAVVRALLDAGADPTPLQWTPLMQAAALGTADDVAAEVRRGGSGNDLAARDRWERTPWLVAVHAGDVAAAGLLLEAGSDRYARERGRRTALTLAASAGRQDMVRWLLDSGADPNAAGVLGTPLMEAAEAGEAECVRLLLAAGADPVAEDEIERRAVNAARTVDVLRALAGAAADLDYVDGTGDWALRSAAEDGDLERLEFLLSAGAAVDTTSTGATALHAAAAENDLAAVRRLLAAGAAVNVLDGDGYTPLHEATSVEVAQALLDAGADVTRAGGMIGQTALEHHADRPEIYDLLQRAAGRGS